MANVGCCRRGCWVSYRAVVRDVGVSYRAVVRDVGSLDGQRDTVERDEEQHGVVEPLLVDQRDAHLA